MTDQTELGAVRAETSPSTAAASNLAEAKPSAQESAKDSVSQFIAVAAKWIPEERIRGDVRVTPKGLFVHKDSLEVTMEAYRRWLHEVAPHVEEPTSARLTKRMFNTASPLLYYLIEPKRVLVGYCIESAVQNPRQFGLPVYLGSLEEATSRIHPRDPLLQCMPQLVVTQTPGGVSFSLTVGDRLVRFNQDLVQLFARLLARNPSLGPVDGGASGVPREDRPLRDILRILVESLSRARVAPVNQRLLLPHNVVRDKSLWCLVDGHVFFPVRGNGNVETIVDRDGRNLSSFLKSELSGLARGGRAPAVDIGTFGQFSPRGGSPHSVGFYRFYGKSYPLSLTAFTQFVKGIIRSVPEPVVSPAGLPKPAGPARVRNWTRFSVVDCIQELGELLASAETVDFLRVQRFVASHESQRTRYRMSGRWIFCLGSRDELDACIDKLLGERAAGSSAPSARGSRPGSSSVRGRGSGGAGGRRRRSGGPGRR